MSPITAPRRPFRRRNAHRPCTALHAALAALACVAALSAPLPAWAQASPQPAAPGSSSMPSSQVAWLPANSDADVDRAFAQARELNRPLLLYWGASWCPPCNRLKATLFNRQDFAAQSRAYVALHVDGDRPGAQRVARRFAVSGYPTMVLFRPDGSEITRLPGEVEAAQVMAVLALGLADGRPVKAVLADALAGRAVSANGWRMLAYYSWEGDQDRVVPAAEVADTLARLWRAAATAAPAAPAADAETTTRLLLKALAASTEAKGLRADAALRERVQRLLADPQQVRSHMAVLAGEAAALARAVAPEADAARSAFVAAHDAALQRLQADPALARADRLTALLGRIELARLDQPRTAVQVTLPPALVADTRQQVARMDREITDGHERQAVITYAAHTLARAGLWADSDALLRSNLPRSHSAYYLMSQLGANARQQGRNAEALDWYAQSYDKAEGPATRLQWGSGYLRQLVDLAPADAARIERTWAALLADAAKDEAAFEGRSLRSLQRAAEKLLAWNAEGSAPARTRMQAQLDTLCRQVDAADGQRAACQALFRPRAAGRTEA
jgi:thiol-disulfide isomerase/thioredoxin